EMPLIRKAVTFAFCQTARSSRKTTAIFVSNCMPSSWRSMTTARERERTLGFIRKICLALPETSERPSHGAPTFFVRKKTFVTVLNDHHGDGRFAIWCAAGEGMQAMLVEADPERFFVPPYVG